MDVLVNLGLLICGFAVLLLGGDALVRSAISLSARAKVSPMIVGLTIVAAGTSAPELMTSIIASLQGNSDIAMGNVVGSNIFNILLILGVASLFRPLHIAPSLSRFEIPALFIFSVAVFVFTRDQFMSRAEGILFLGASALFLWLSVKRARLLSNAQPIEQELKALKHSWMDITYLIGGIVFLIGGAHLALQSGISLGKLAGLTDRVIGVTIISIGTGLPELATSTIAAYRGQNEIAISNVIGSNIINTLFVLGSAATIKPFSAGEQLIYFDTLWMITATAILIPLGFLGKKIIHRWVGGLFLAFYAGYLYLII